MQKFYEVKLYAEMIVVVKADDHDEACDIAQGEVGCGDYRFYESSSSVIEDKHLEASKRHADLVIED